ncbi:MAG: hypothetical protein ACI9BD_000324 [Candidatus Marinamargulisbacteria bacterium]|jgi:hypothetical protein
MMAKKIFQIGVIGLIAVMMGVSPVFSQSAGEPVDSGNSGAAPLMTAPVETLLSTGAITDSLSKILKLNGVVIEKSLSGQSADGKTSISRSYQLKAAGVRSEFPDLVSSYGNEISIRYNEFVPILIEALKAQEAKIEAMQAEIKALKGQ